MSKKNNLRWIFFLLSLLSLNGCRFFEEERDKARIGEEIHDQFGVAYNSIRQRSGMPVLPQIGWGDPGRNLPNKLAVCRFEKNSPRDDTSARWALKEVYFYTATRQAVRETDTYYSGKKYETDDPDFMDWERVEISYAYAGDTLAQIDVLKAHSTEPNVMKKGSRQARLIGPKPHLTTIGTDNKEVTVLRLESRPISMAQADSVLSRWGLTR